MADFKYKARDKFSRSVAGVIAAESEDAAAKKLQEMGYVPITIEAVRQLKAGAILERFNRVKLEELSMFTRQLYSLQKAGLPLLASLEAISQQTENNYFRTEIEQITRDIRAGMTLSDSLRKHGKIFDDVYVSMMKAAEAGGSLVNILERLTGLLEQEIDTQGRIKAAMRYPMIAFAVLCLGFLIVVAFVIPRFALIYRQFNTALPLPTLILIGISVAIQKYWYLLILGLSGLIYGFLRFINSKTGRPIYDNIKLKIPIFGTLLTMLIMSRFARITSILMKSGVPILEVLDLVSNSSGNIIISRAIMNIKESVNQGKGMSGPMAVSGLFPAAVIQMVAAGEQSGRVDELLSSVADYYDTESGFMIKNLTTYIEPILILVLGAMVLVMALAIFLPWWNLIKLFRPS